MRGNRRRSILRSTPAVSNVGVPEFAEEEFQELCDGLHGLESVPCACDVDGFHQVRQLLRAQAENASAHYRARGVGALMEYGVVIEHEDALAQK